LQQTRAPLLHASEDHRDRLPRDTPSLLFESPPCLKPTYRLFTQVFEQSGSATQAVA
jgi:hypothetical protein